MAENWINRYTENSDINYGASDYETYRSAFIELLQKLYPENFNDYIDNSEIIMLISSLAYLGENLNYVIEMNTRDNFPATTERLASLLNFARMINYPVRRNRCANGLAKIVQIQTDEDLYDSFGNSLKNYPIKWNDVSNIYWYEQMMIVLNSAFINSNPFGIPIDSKVIEDETYNLYSINTISRNGVAYPYTAVVNGISMDFEAVNPIIENNKLTEHYPDDENYYNIIYKNDGSGYDSANNGFFIWFKQGTSNTYNETVSEKETFHTMSLTTTNINDSDIWVEELNTDGSIKAVWKQVESVHNTSYNNIDPDNRKIYQVITDTNDNVTLKFGDGLTAEIPFGNFRVVYRTSNGLVYAINPKEMTNISISIPYQDSSYKSDQVFHLLVTFSLQEQVNNSLPSLTVSDIQDNLPAVVSTQNRMVSDKDYNYFPLSFNNIIKKVIAENRVYSGVIDDMISNNQSNLIQNVNIVVDDGYVFKYDEDKSISVPLPTLLTSSAIVDTYILPILEENGFEDFYYDKYSAQSGVIDGTTGKIEITGYEGDYSIGTINFSSKTFFNQGSLVKLLDSNNNATWVSIISMDESEVVLNTKLTIGTWTIDRFYGPFNRTFSDSINDYIINIMDQITALNISGTSITKFGLRYDKDTLEWKVIEGSDIVDDDFSLDNQGISNDSSWLIYVEWTPSAWYIKYRTKKYVFGSIDTVKFPKILDESIVNYKNNTIDNDFVKFLKINIDPQTGNMYPEDIKLSLTQNEYYDDGSLNNSIVDMDLNRSGLTNTITNPDIINDLIGINSTDKEEKYDHLIFFKREESSYGYYVWNYIDSSLTSDASDNIIIVKESTTELEPGVYYITGDTNHGFVKVDASYNMTRADDEYRVYDGRIGLYAQYKHYATEHIKIDPVPSAFIEMYVLTANNYKAVMDWKADPNRTLDTFPLYPTEYELIKEFEALEEYKMLTDEMIWRPLKFKLLFGKEADEKLKADIKVTKRNTSLVADNIIRQRVLMYMEEFFDNSRWLNTKEFNYTELGSYIYQNMSNDITNCVIVPLYEDYKFGKLQQIRFDEYEIPLNVATLDNIKVIPYISDENIRIGK